MSEHRAAKHECRFVEDLVSEGRVSFEDGHREQFSEDAGPHEPAMPDAVVWPATTEEVSDVLREANDRGVPVTPWSGGSSLEGHGIPVEGGIVLNTFEMEDVEVRPEDLQAVVGPGIIYDDLNEQLATYGLRFPPGISSGELATIGGMIATNASGLNAVRYGETRDHVLRLEVVLPDGRIVECGRDVMKTSAGYSLKDLLIGSEGTLGVVTEATLSLAGIPERKQGALVSFPSKRAASSAVSEIIQFGLRPGAIEFVDALSIELINENTDGEDLPVEPTLLLELHANNEGIEEDLEFALGICEDNDALEWIERSGDGMDDIWRARRDLYPALRALGEDRDVAIIGDVVVPISRYPDIVETVAEISAELDLMTPCAGHAGDGNLHFLPVVDTTDPAEIDGAHELNERVIEAAIDMGGTSTGEHGIGDGKRKFMRREHGGAVSLMADLKRTIDPNGIMNPGKVIPDED